MPIREHQSVGTAIPPTPSLTPQAFFPTRAAMPGSPALDDRRGDRASRWVTSAQHQSQGGPAAGAIG